jgi:hypothetical protein
MGQVRASSERALGAYVLERKLGTGGMAEVFLARRSGPHGFSKRVAIKKILPELARDPQLIQMFCDEARLAASLNHPNIAQVLEFGEQDGELYLVMEHVDGVSCSTLLRAVSERGETIPTGPALVIARDVLLALGFAHEATDEDGLPLGVVHRDVSPSNILVSRIGTVKLIDFGITRSFIAERRTFPGELKGKLRYMSPEQILGADVDARSIVQPVTWPVTPLVLNAGQGNLQQWNLSIEKQVSPTSVEVSTTPCGIYLPDLQSSLFGGFAKFGIRFPDSLFDAGGIAKVPFTLTTEFGADGGLVLKTDPFALIAGAKLDHPTSEPWPGAAGLMLLDQDLDGRPGVTVIPATGSGYSDPPTDLLNDQADFIYIAERTVQALTFTVNTCDEIDGSVNIATIDGSAAIDSSVVGCHVMGGSDCTTDQAQFIDQNRPKFLPSSAGTMISVRIPDASTCADVRSRFPLMQ